ncbi:unnamed protein product [Cochlearia groenlandica]
MKVHSQLNPNINTDVTVEKSVESESDNVNVNTTINISLPTESEPPTYTDPSELVLTPLESSIEKAPTEATSLSHDSTDLVTSFTTTSTIISHTSPSCSLSLVSPLAGTHNIPYVEDIIDVPPFVEPTVDVSQCEQSHEANRFASLLSLDENEDSELLDSPSQVSYLEVSMEKELSDVAKDFTSALSQVKNLDIDPSQDTTVIGEPSTYVFSSSSVDMALRSRGGRSLKPSQKLKEMEWTTVTGKGRRGRG